MKKFFKWVFIILGVMFVIGLIGAMFGDGGNNSSNQTSNTTTSAAPTEESVSSPAPAEEVIKVRARDLAAAYDDNEAAADAKYKDKLLEVSGVIASIDKGMLDETNVMLQGKNEFLHVAATLEKSEEQKAINLHKRQTITLRCIGNSEVAGMPMLKDCTIL